MMSFQHFSWQPMTKPQRPYAEVLRIKEESPWLSETATIKLVHYRIRLMTLMTFQVCYGHWDLPVQTKTNVNQLEMEEAVNKFVQEIQNGDVALFYFSGHGVQVKGENYLIPLGAPIQSEPDVRFKTLNAGLVLAKMEDSRNRTNIVILDACRNNPFKGLFRSASTGLSKMDAPKGTFIAYATSPDSVAADGTGRNSPYTKHLIEALKVKDIPIDQAFKRVAKAVNKETGGKQTPWISSSLLDDFYFNPSSLDILVSEAI